MRPFLLCVFFEAVVISSEALRLGNFVAFAF
jgi:hypothetical protein